MTPERILIVDDNLTNRRILSVSLAKAGYETREAVDGVEAIDVAVAWQPDLILLDVDMPGKDGFEVCAALKAREEVANAAVIFLTALSSPCNSFPPPLPYSCNFKMTAVLVSSHIRHCGSSIPSRVHSTTMVCLPAISSS
jgi:hypothetical protein